MRKLLGAGVVFALLLVVAGLAVAGGNRNYSVHLNGGTEVPANASKAVGQVKLRLSADGASLDYTLITANLDNPIAAHIHLGPPGAGTANGLLAEGTITAANLVGPLDGQPLSALIDALNAGNAYVNVHTNDGVPPTGTGPGDFPGGEIRGNL
jgi:hypothetical protein